MSLNKATLIGRLTKTPIVKYTQSGVAVTDFGLATNEYFKGKDGSKAEKTQFHNIVVWSKMAENCGNYLQKGSLVYVEGRIETRKWQDKEGRDNYKTEIIATNIQFLSTVKNADSSNKNDLNVSQDNNVDVQFSADDIPF